MKQKPPQGFINGIDYLIHEPGTYVIRDRGSLLCHIEIVEAYKGEITGWDSVAASGNLIFFMRSGKGTTLSKGVFSMSVQCEKGLTIKVTEKCHIIVRSVGPDKPIY